MTQSQLMALILNQMIAHIPYLPYIVFGVNVGRCPFCLVSGDVNYSSGVTTYQHTAACAFTLNDQLQASLREEENKA